MIFSLHDAGFTLEQIAEAIHKQNTQKYSSCKKCGDYHNKNISCEVLSEIRHSEALSCDLAR